ncbi:MAG: hypothetical protein OER43_00600 [Gammaproteobacteria bacterium]|nr:hypothetical protein [Gammaproteobacteria bacterium]
MTRKIEAMALLGPGPTAVFEFHVAEWLGNTARGAAPTFPEAEQMRVPKILCVHGEKEKESLCRRFTSPSVQTLMTKGSHHFGGEYQSIADAILRLGQ